MAQENKQEGLNALLVSGGNTYEEGFDPGSAGNGTLVTTVTALYMGQDAKVVPAVATFDKWAKKVDPQTQLDLYTLYGWINAELFVQALKGAGADPTRASLEAQLDKVTSFNASGLISTAEPGPEDPRAVLDRGPVRERDLEAHRARPQGGLRLQPRRLLPEQLQGHLALGRRHAYPPWCWNDGRAQSERS